ncbi:MAG: NfeD family protein [Anaeroplasma sp.]
MIEQYMIWIWLVAFVTAVVLEAITQDYISIWFAVGALVALIVSNWVPFWAEIIIFSVVSVAALLGTRPLVKKLTDRSERKTNSDDFVGKRLKAITDISKYDAGVVKLNGIEYTAILMEDEYDSIPKDSIVEVVALKGNRVVVKEICEEE